MGCQEFHWNQKIDNLPEHDIHYRATQIETLISIDETEWKRFNIGEHDNAKKKKVIATSYTV